MIPMAGQNLDEKAGLAGRYVITSDDQHLSSAPGHRSAHETMAHRDDLADQIVVHILWRQDPATCAPLSYIL